ncbi:ubiquitin interaction domain-containing protein [Cordyceps fumosorosea ARSEF 2679]|uniref:Ubiquitin interaction domain-containing protein n=1 Tax=Cordyceps fumosorosea (strain ARSEF 2679) TaxID=1081104 RepID=A0A168DEY2_CORFA|nr:ubiquitin interaction domain-containing protein [Cordyceps fumosorosea ARSEF 2679]OAA72527.1 ubiquitin interaction domain-containing protein [Cordyceps fumosorosea ARSEF 2679]
MEPTEDQISQVIDFAGLDRLADRDMVIQALKNNGGNSEAVIMSYFDNPDSFRQRFTMQWNDSMFGADRNGENDNTAGSSFHIEEPNPNPSFFIESMDNSMHEGDVIAGVTPPPDRYSLGAPSRPPSRSNAKSPLGRMIDITASDAPRFVDQTDQDQLSQDMERALRESAQEAGIAAPGQESGVLENYASTPHFGPATRTQYENDDWAMVRLAATASRASNALPASDRQRKTDAPAFLVQHPNTVGSHKLGGVLTILHEIPLARNALLRCGEPCEAYGFDSEWWQGKSITPVQSVHVQTPGSDLESPQEEDATPGFEAEIHRLMAFLDSTERSYGSSSILTNMIPDPATGVEKQFYEHLGQRHGEHLHPLTQVASLTLLHDDGSSDEPSDGDARFGLLEIEHLKGDYNHIKTLYEALDHLMWSDVLSWNEISDESKMAVFKDMGEVLALKFGGEGPEDSLDIPTEFYPERYLTTRKREAGRIQTAWCETKLAMMRIAREEKEVREWRDDFNQISFNKKAKMEKAVEHWKVFEKYLQSAGQFAGMQQSGFDTNRFPDYHDAPGCPSEIQQQAADKVGDVLKLVERVLADVDKALEGLDAELARLKAKQRSLGRLLTDPDKPDRPQPMTCKKYLLRGVATERDVIFVCRRQQTDLVDLGDSASKRDQWWRLAYALGEEHPVKAEKIEMERVMREVWQETKTPLIIYATEDALRIPNDPLTLPLERFVKADNKTFRNELNMERANKQENSPREYQFLDPISPSKRKHRSSSPDSLDTNHASLGSDGDNAFDNPFEDQAASFSVQGGNYEPHVVTTDDLPEFADMGPGDGTQLELVQTKPIYREVAPGPPQEMEQLPPLQPFIAASVKGHSEESPKTDSVRDVEMPSLEKES